MFIIFILFVFYSLFAGLGATISRLDTMLFPIQNTSFLLFLFRIWFLINLQVSNDCEIDMVDRTNWPLNSIKLDRDQEPGDRTGLFNLLFCLGFFLLFFFFPSSQAPHPVYFFYFYVKIIYFQNLGSHPFLAFSIIPSCRQW